MTADRITYRFSVPGAPVSTNRIWKVGHGHAYESKSAKAWKRAVFDKAEEAGLRADPLVGDLRIRITYCHQHPKRRLDLDNVIKGVLDGLAPYFNDKRVQWIEISREHCPEAPRIEVRIEAEGAH